MSSIFAYFISCNNFVRYFSNSMGIHKIIIGARGSKLSLIQTDIVKNKLQALLPGIEIIVQVITTKGDKDMSPVPLDSIWKGWFTREIDKSLLGGSIDLAVHSLKDLPETLEEGLIIAAIPQREDAREAMVSKTGVSFDKLRKGAIIGTDSTRRGSQILNRRADLVIKSLRGSVITRLEKLEREDYDAIFLAVAGLKRLGLEERITEYFEAVDFIPSPGQGALALVTKKDSIKLNTLLQKLNHEKTVIAVKAERAFSDAIGGGCKMPVGSYAEIDGERLVIYAFIGSLDGRNVDKDSIEGDITKPVELGTALADKLIEQCKPWYTKENDR